MEQNTEHTARASGRDLFISTRHTIEITRCIRGKDLQKSKAFLQRVLEKKQAVPFLRHDQDIPHRPGHIMAGRYPEKATKVILSLLNAVEANAQNNGLDTENLVIKSIIPNRASRPYRYGRIRGIRSRRTHVEIVVEERESKKDATKEKRQHVQQPVKKEIPKEQKKQPVEGVKKK